MMYGRKFPRRERDQTTKTESNPISPARSSLDGLLEPGLPVGVGVDLRREKKGLAFEQVRGEDLGMLRRGEVCRVKRREGERKGKGKREESVLATREEREKQGEGAHLIRTVVRSPFRLVLKESKSLNGVSFVQGEAMVDLRDGGEDATREGEKRDELKVFEKMK